MKYENFKFKDSRDVLNITNRFYDKDDNKYLLIQPTVGIIEYNKTINEFIISRLKELNILIGRNIIIHANISFDNKYEDLYKLYGLKLDNRHIIKIPYLNTTNFEKSFITDSIEKMFSEDEDRFIISINDMDFCTSMFVINLERFLDDGILKRILFKKFIE